MLVPWAGQTHWTNEKQAIKVLENKKDATPKTIVKALFIHHQNTNMFPPNCYNPGVQNIYYSAAYMIVCVLHGNPVLSATYSCWEWSNKGK